MQPRWFILTLATAWTMHAVHTRLRVNPIFRSMPRIYLSQELVEARLAEGRLQLQGDRLYIGRPGHALALYIDSAVLFEGVEGASGDPHEILGCVKSSRELAVMGAEHCDTSVLVGDIAYTVRPGFLATPVGPDGAELRLDDRDWSQLAFELGQRAA